MYTGPYCKQILYWLTRVGAQNFFPKNKEYFFEINLPFSKKRF